MRVQRRKELSTVEIRAACWFAARGWRRIERSAAPAGIAASREFAALCPASAALMEREL